MSQINKQNSSRVYNSSYMMTKDKSANSIEPQLVQRLSCPMRLFICTSVQTALVSCFLVIPIKLIMPLYKPRQCSYRSIPTAGNFPVVSTENNQNNWSKPFQRFIRIFILPITLRMIHRGFSPFYAQYLVYFVV